MENIVKNITEAEEKAAAIKAVAEEKAARIIAEAEEKARRMEKDNSSLCKILRETKTAEAVKASDERYASSIKEAEEKAKAYANARISNTDKFVNDAVGRIVSGNS